MRKTAHRRSLSKSAHRLTSSPFGASPGRLAGRPCRDRPRRRTVSRWQSDVSRHVGVSLTPDETYDAAVTDTLPGLSAGLAVLFVVLVPLHLLMLDGTPQIVLTACAAASALVVAAFAVVVRRHRLPDHLAQPAAAGLVLVVVANAVTHMVLDRAAPPDDVRHARRRGRRRGPAVAPLAGRDPVPRLGCMGRRRVPRRTGRRSGSDYVAACAAPRCSPASSTIGAGRMSASWPTCAPPPTRPRSATTSPGSRTAAGWPWSAARSSSRPAAQGDAVHCIFVEIDSLDRVNDALGHARRRRGARGRRRGAAQRHPRPPTSWPVGAATSSASSARVRAWRRSSSSAGSATGRPRRAGAGRGLAGRVSAGGAMLTPWDPGTLETLLGKADQEMYLRRSLRKEASALPQRRRRRLAARRRRQQLSRAPGRSVMVDGCEPDCSLPGRADRRAPRQRGDPS